ncbi:MAG: ribosomal protein L16, partial [Chloroflexi bacterium]|nr:ribosomal protein L16 [Chloroflexota bacterium]
MLQPRRTKYRKSMRGRNRGLAHRGSTVAFGEVGLKSLTAVWLTSRQIEA